MTARRAQARLYKWSWADVEAATREAKQKEACAERLRRKQDATEAEVIEEIAPLPKAPQPAPRAEVVVRPDYHTRGYDRTALSTEITLLDLDADFWRRVFMDIHAGIGVVLFPSDDVSLGEVMYVIGVCGGAAAIRGMRPAAVSIMADELPERLRAHALDHKRRAESSLLGIEETA